MDIKNVFENSDVNKDSDLQKSIKKKGIAKINAEDVIRLGMEIEKKSEKLYNMLAHAIEDKNINSLFYHLAEEEDKHYKKMEQKLFDLGHFLNIKPLNETPEHTAAMALYSSDVLFNKDELKFKIRKITSIESVFEFAISLELDNILYYQEIKDIVNENNHKFIDELVDEERLHFLKLLQKKQELGL